MARPALYGEPASEIVKVRVTPGQLRDLEQIVKDNQSASISTVIRDAVDQYVADYREAPVFRGPKPAERPHNIDI